MSETGRINREFEILIGYNGFNEVRPDTVGALSDEIRWSEERRNHYIKNNGSILNEENQKSAGRFYQGKDGNDKFFRHRSRGKAGPSLEILGTVKVDYDNDLIYDIPAPKKNFNLKKKL